MFNGRKIKLFRIHVINIVVFLSLILSLYETRPDRYPHIKENIIKGKHISEIVVSKNITYATKNSDEIITPSELSFTLYKLYQAILTFIKNILLTYPR